MTNQKEKPIIGITTGDINGIGPEIIIKALSDNRILQIITPVIYGSTKTLSYYKKMFKREDFNYSQIRSQEKVNHKRVNVINCWDETIEINVGKSTPQAGRSSLLALEKAVEDLKSGFIEGLVTAPINKKNIHSESFPYKGHTDYLTEKFEAVDNLMFMIAENLRIGVVTGHIPLKDVPGKITREKLQTKLKIMERSMFHDFAINKPKIAVLGLNPHAGENGLIGVEENEIILPVIEEFKEKGNLIFGPFPADGFFGSSEYKKFDAILAMYHDQGLIPFKTMAFDIGVNFTAGLPIIRTSPDHGTAYTIAGQNIANERSLRDAIFLATDIYKNRKEQEVVES